MQLLIPGLGLPIRESFEISDTPDAAEAARVAAFLRELYGGGEADEVVLVYQQFRSVLQQRPVSMSLLPMTLEAAGGEDGSRWLFEPDRDSLLSVLAELALTNTVHTALLEARTSPGKSERGSAEVCGIPRKRE